MIILTTPVPLPNINRIRLDRFMFDHDGSQARLTFGALSPGGSPRMRQFEIIVTNDSCTRLVVNPLPMGWDDSLLTETASIPDAFDTLEAAFSAASKPNRRRVIEQTALTLGLIEATLAGTVA